jgi:isopenicillin-N epimerase
MSGADIHDGDAEARQWRGKFALDDGVSYLNHGSYGLSPRPVLDAWTEWIRRIDKNRLGFYRREAATAIAETRGRLAEFVGATEDRIEFFTNATMAILAVARSFPLSPGDEVLITDHDYWSISKVWQRACDEAGAKLVVMPITLPIVSREKIVVQLLSGVTERTRLIIFSHVNYRTSIIMPADAICRRAREMGIPVLVDGAHALAQLPLDIERLDCDYYAASCHKWLCAPVGTGFLYVHPRCRAILKSLTASRTDESHDVAFIGTDDHSRTLSIPAAIDFLESAGLEYFRERTHALAQYARERISGLTGLDSWFPDSPEWYGSLVSLELPPVDESDMIRALWEKYRIEAYIKTWNDRPLIRVACHLYTQAAEIDLLTDALSELGIG